MYSNTLRYSKLKNNTTHKQAIKIQHVEQYQQASLFFGFLLVFGFLKTAPRQQCTHPENRHCCEWTIYNSTQMQVSIHGVLGRMPRLLDHDQVGSGLCEELLGP